MHSKVFQHECPSVVNNFTAYKLRGSILPSGEKMVVLESYRRDCKRSTISHYIGQTTNCHKLLLRFHQFLWLPLQKLRSQVALILTILVVSFKMLWRLNK